MECSSLVALGVLSTVTASDTEVPENEKQFNILKFEYVCIYNIRSYLASFTALLQQRSLVVDIS